MLWATGLLSCMLLASNAFGISLQGSAQMLSVLQDKVKPWSGDVQNVPDGKMWMMRKDPNDKSAGFIINTTPNNFASSTSSSINDITGPYNDPKTEYQNGDSQSNFALQPAPFPIPSPEETGMRGNGSNYDENTLWIFNAFRLSETSQSSADPNHLIGFEHNEDYWRDQDASHPGQACTYKSIAVRYSNDLGKSWTRSVPILTKGIQNTTCDMDHQFTGTGDFVTMWNSAKKEWLIIAQEGPLVMSHSSDPLAKPGTWTRFNPAAADDHSATQPGFIGSTDGTTLAHSDLESIGGANPSIIYDTVNKLWHMVYSRWGSGLAYTQSTDLYRWSTPVIIWDDSTQGGKAPGSKYPTLVGDEGDLLTTTGTATLLFGADNHVEWGRALWSVGVDFGGGSDGGDGDAHLPSDPGGSSGNSSTAVSGLTATAATTATTSSPLTAGTSSPGEGRGGAGSEQDDCDV